MGTDYSLTDESADARALSEMALEADQVRLTESLVTQNTGSQPQAGQRALAIRIPLMTCESADRKNDAL
jgi:hypothetical protein